MVSAIVVNERRVDRPVDENMSGRTVLQSGSIERYYRATRTHPAFSKSTKLAKGHLYPAIWCAGCEYTDKYVGEILIRTTSWNVPEADCAPENTVCR
jgi:hypothetical protein